MKKIPFILSIPHGGTKIPDELINQTCITKADLFDDSDAFTQEIFHSGNVVKYQIETSIARAFVDVSRSPAKMPPEYTDGLIKSATCYNKPIYWPGKHPDKEMITVLMKKYYNLYHKKIKKYIADKEIMLGIDCHSMANIAPVISPDKGQMRPLINLGDANGKACDRKITEMLKKSFLEIFKIEEKELTINIPFKGGFITRFYGNNPIPWLQIEINRKLYLADAYFDRKNFAVSPQRIIELNDKFKATLKQFYNYLQKAQKLHYIR